MDYIVHGVTKSQTRLSDFYFDQSLNVMISLQSHWQNLSFFKKLSATLKSEKYIVVVWIYISLIMNEFDHFFMFIIYSPACVFLWIIHVFFYFSTGLLILCPSILKNSLCIREITFCLYKCCEYFIAFCQLSSDFVYGILGFLYTPTLTSIHD